MNFNFLKNPLIFGSITSIVVVILFILDSKITKKTLTKKDYFKIFLFVFLTNTLLMYFMNINNLFNNIPVKDVKESISENVKKVRETLDTGIADF